MTSYFKYTIAITVKKKSIIRMGVVCSMSYQSINKDKGMPKIGK
jgi:hypothetical protein